jgi:hypothetical protein
MAGLRRPKHFKYDDAQKKIGKAKDKIRLSKLNSYFSNLDKPSLKRVNNCFKEFF